MVTADSFDATDWVDLIRARKVSATCVAEHFLARISKHEEAINAFVSFDPEQVRAQASRIAAAGNVGVLAGLPIAVKDMFDTADQPTEFYSPIYRGNRPSRDAHVVSLLRQAGAVILGKTHTTEFAFMHTGPTCNPHDTARTPGSSSAGSAAGLAAGFFPIALGTQTGGSLIKPASYCGIHAFRPSFGLVSLEGVKPLASSFDTVGWFGASARDLELVARVLIPGLPRPVSTSSKLKLAFCRTSKWAGIDDCVRLSIEHAVDVLIHAGHVVTEIVLPSQFDTVYQDHQVINDCEGARSLSKEVQVHSDQISPETLAMFSRASSSTWDEETAARARLEKLVPILRDMIAPFDAVLTASCGCVAPLGLESTGPSDLIKMWMAFGLPQVNIPLEPYGTTLPVGLQIIGKYRDDASLLKVAEKIDADLLAYLRQEAGPAPA